MALITLKGDALILQPSAMCPDTLAVPLLSAPVESSSCPSTTTAAAGTGTGINRKTRHHSSSGYVSDECAHTASYDSCEILKHFNWDLHINENGDGCGSLSVNELCMEEAACGQQQYPAVFRWTGAGQTVSLSGSFNSWREKIPLVKSHGEFYTVVEIAEGTHQYKYYVDGEWVCHPNEPKVDNGMGSQNNVLTIKGEDCDIYRVLASDSLGTVAADPTASPPGSYSQYVPSKDTGFGFHRLGPPLLPPHLLDTVLNKEVPAHCEPMMVPEPNHVVINHLFTLSIKGGVMVLGTTHRYRKKYITTLLYKPI